MARTKSIPDAQVHAAIRQLLAPGGDKAVSFGAVGRAVGLAPSTLVQRFGTVSAMRLAAIRQGWDQLAEATATALEAASGKGPQGMLKALDDVSGIAVSLVQAATDAESRILAADWRRMVETALSVRLGQGEKAREAAAILFAAWQGQALWGDDSFRIKDAVKRLS